MTLKNHDLWIDWTDRSEVTALMDKVATHGIPAELGREFVTKLEVNLVDPDVINKLQEDYNELEAELTSLEEELLEYHRRDLTEGSK